MNNNVITKVIVVSALVGALVGSGTTLVIQKQNVKKPSPEELIAEFYESENAVYVSPHSLRTKMSKGETDSYVLVDLRSQEEYEKEHIATAVNVPAYKDANTSVYDEKERIVGQFRELVKNSPEKDLIVYCYSIPCMTGRKVGKMLVENGIYVKHLGIGWNEWRYFWSLWNHDMETPTKMEDYITTGREPGLPKIQELPSPCEEGELSC